MNSPIFFIDMIFNTVTFRLTHLYYKNLKLLYKWRIGLK
jgi:hypothetical protein